MKKIIKFIFILSLLIVTGCSVDGVTQYDEKYTNNTVYIIYENGKITGMRIYFEYTASYATNKIRKEGIESLEDLYNYLEQEAREIKEISPMSIGVIVGRKTTLYDYPAISIDQPSYIENISLQMGYHFNLKNKDFSKDNVVLKKALEILGLNILLKKDITIKELLADKNFIFHSCFESENSTSRTYSRW